MKAMMRKSIVITVLLLLAALIIGLSGCTAIQIGGELVIRGDGSGSRSYIMHLFNSTNNDGYGNAYQYSRLHGDALKTKIEATLRGALGDISWLTVSIGQGTAVAGNGQNSPVELITLSFNFTSFEDYIAKKSSLARFGENRLPAGSRFTPPVYQEVRGGMARYREPALTTLWTIRPLFLALFDDPEVFDFTSGGTNTVATLQELREYGLEMKSVPIRLTLGSNAPKSIVSGTDINEQFRR